MQEQKVQEEEEELGGARKRRRSLYDAPRVHCHRHPITQSTWKQREEEEDHCLNIIAI